MKAIWKRWTAGFGSRSLGVEITDTHVKWLETSDGRPPKLHVADAEPLPEGAVDEGRILQPAAVLQALQTLFARSPSKTRRVHLILPSSLTMVRFFKLPDVPRKDLKRMIDFELRYNIPLPFEKPYYDFMKLPGFKLPETEDGAPEANRVIGSQKSGASAGTWDTGLKEVAATKEAEEENAKPLKECEVMLVAAPLDTIEDYAALLASAGLRPISIEIKALSLYRVVERLQPLDPKATFVSVDITPTYTDVSVYHNGALRITRNKPMRFPEKAPEETVDWEQLEFQTACQDLASEIERFINFYRYSLNHREQEMDGMVVSGDIEGLDSVVAYLSERFSFAVGKIGLDELSFDEARSLPLSGFAGSLGLSIRGSAG